MKKITLFLMISLTFLSVQAQDKYFVAFCADGGVPGHAFISIGRESAISQSSVHDGTWGLYPATSSGAAKSIVIGEVPGGLRDDFLRNKDYTYVIEVSKAEYDMVKSTISKWKNKNYELAETDCLSFVIEVATIFSARITIPPRTGFDNFPARYLKKLIEVN